MRHKCRILSQIVLQMVLHTIVCDIFLRLSVVNLVREKESEVCNLEILALENAIQLLSVVPDAILGSFSQCHLENSV